MKIIIIFSILLIVVIYYYKSKNNIYYNILKFENDDIKGEFKYFIENVKYNKKQFLLYFSYK